MAIDFTCADGAVYGVEGLGFKVLNLAFFWLALRTLTFWVSI